MSENECCTDVVVRTPSFFAEINTATQTTEALQDLEDTITQVEAAADAAELSSTNAAASAAAASTSASNASTSASAAASSASAADSSASSAGTSASAATASASTASTQATNASASATAAAGSATAASGSATAASDSASAASASAAAAAASAAEANVAFVTVATGTLNLALTHVNKIVEFSGACVVTIPPDSSVAFPDNTKISLFQNSASTVSVVGGAGVTIKVPDTKIASLQCNGALATLVKKGASDDWILIGMLGNA